MEYKIILPEDIVKDAIKLYLRETILSDRNFNINEVEYNLDDPQENEQFVLIYIKEEEQDG